MYTNGWGKHRVAKQMSQSNQSAGYWLFVFHSCKFVVKSFKVQRKSHENSPKALLGYQPG
jgi:ribosomal protein S6